MGQIASVPATPSTWEGYAGRNHRNGAGFPEGRRSATVGILVWKWDRADAKQQLGDFARLEAWRNAFQDDRVRSVLRGVESGFGLGSGKRSIAEE